MNARHLFAAALALCGGLSSAARGQPVCKTVHPGYFTYVQERRELDKVSDTSSYDLYEPEGQRRGDTASPEDHPNLFQQVRLAMPECMDSNKFLPGRFVISERSEVVIHFKPGMVRASTGQLGRLDAEGQIISGTNARALELPGYREIGKAVPEARDQLRDSETLLADVQLVLDAAANEPDRAKPTGHRARKSAASSDEPPSMFAPGNLVKYGPAFMDIANNADILLAQSDQAGDRSAASVLQSVLLVSNLGRRALEVLRGDSPSDRLARSGEDLEIDQARWYIDGFLSRAATLAAGRDLGSLDAHSEGARVCAPDAAFSASAMDWCAVPKLAEACMHLQDAAAVLCNPNPPDPASFKTAAARVAKPLPIDLQTAANEIPVRWMQQRTELQAMTPAQLAAKSDELVKAWLAWDEEPGGNTPPPVDETSNAPSPQRDQGIPGAVQAGRCAIPECQSMREQLGQIKAELLEIDPKKLQRASRVVRQALQSRLDTAQEASFREIRFQPRVLGAHAGDVIEVTISYAPPGSEPGARPPPGPDAAPVPELASDGRRRVSSWTLRFLVDRIGWYVQAGPRLSLNFSWGYNAKAANYKGAMGAISPGIGVDLVQYPGDDIAVPLRAAAQIFSGVGLRVDNLDFDASQAVELGLEGHLMLFRGIVSVGVGWNTSVYPGANGRNMYWSVGLGLQQILDEAMRLAEEAKR